MLKASMFISLHLRELTAACLWQYILEPFTIHSMTVTPKRKPNDLQSLSLILLFSIRSNAADAYNLGGARSSVPNGAGSQIEPVRYYLWNSLSRHEVYFTKTPMKFVTKLLITWQIDRHLEGNSRLVVIKNAGHAVKYWEAQGSVPEHHRVFQGPGCWSCKRGRQGGNISSLTKRLELCQSEELQDLWFFTCSIPRLLNRWCTSPSLKLARKRT